MTESLYAVALLACPVGMGLMMWFMMRGGKNAAPATPPLQPTRDPEFAQLRAEIDQLCAAQRARRDDVGSVRSGGSGHR